MVASRSRGSRSPPTTRASRGAAAARSGAARSATSSPTSGCSPWARSCCSRAGLRTPVRCSPRSPPAASRAALALVALGVDETKEPFANIYSAAVSLQNVVPRVPQRVLISRRRGGDGRELRHRPRQLPGLPLPARLVLRPALRRAARAVARGRSASTFRAPEFRPGQIAAWLAGFAFTSGSRRSGRARGSTSSITPTRPGRDRRLAAELCPRLRRCRSALRLRVVRPLAVIGPLNA